jgi:alpha-mannosidase
LQHKIRWTPQKIASRLALIQPLEYLRRQPLSPFRYQTLPNPEAAPLVDLDIDDSKWEQIQHQSYWGTWQTNFMLRTEFSIPATWISSSNPIVLHLPMGDMGDFSHPEALAYIDGNAYASADRHHHEIQLPDSLKDGKSHLLALHGWTGNGGWPPSIARSTRPFIGEAAVAEIHQPTRDFIAKVRIVLELANLLDEDDLSKGRLLNALDAAFITLDTRNPLNGTAFYQSVPAALKILELGLDAAGAPMDVDIIAIGHAHIDVAWLWTLGQTRRKAGRTFSNVLRMMEQFPDYHFSQSQPQLYKYTEETYPEIFEEIKKRVKEGRWEAMGGTWIEPDCNATGAESLARQFLLGRNYFRKHFGDVDTPVLWLPDTFGYSWALPQLIKQAGMKYFITHKMSWNQYNQMPFQLLWWQGIDGTKVLTHFLTTPEGSELLPFSTTYNGNVSAEQILGTWHNFRQKHAHNELITAYGYGDGGGGPTREMLENIQTFSKLAGAPRVRGGTIREFMDRVESQVSESLPVWNGEFYLELHRGTLTSQARNKWNNRKSEFLLHDAEFVAAFAALLSEDYQYPHEAFNAAWELVCLNQFHDILPGSSITLVYEDSARDYQAVRLLAEKERDEALNLIAKTLPADTAVMVVNPTSFGGDRLGLLNERLDGALLDKRNGDAVLVQNVEEGSLVNLSGLEAFSVLALSKTASAPELDSLQIKESGDTLIFENPLLAVQFARNGDIVSIYDKEAERDVLAEGKVGNQLLALEDRPLAWDAWDVDIFYDDRVEKIEGVQSFELIEKGPLRACLLVKRLYQSSCIDQKIYFYHNSKRIDFDTYIDWHEHHTLLKVAFAVDILSPRATFDIQWGNVERNTHRNTSWDWGRFETAAQKWADLSEGSYGVALLNDSKYGYDVLDNVMRLSLLKSPTMPDPDADQGEHLMRYSLLPHTGDWRNGVAPAAYDLNDPLILRRVSSTKGTNASQELISLSAANVIIETIKQAEDSNGIIVRLYENERKRGPVTIKAGFNLKAAYYCNLLEENESSLSVKDNSITLNMRPYQIATLRLLY